MIGHYSQLAHQGISNPSRSMCNGGGGGGDSTDTRYANLDQLYGVQKQASEYMLNNAMPHIPGLTQNSARMNEEAQNGTLAAQMRQQAGNNAQSTLGAALASNDRNAQRYGMGMNTNRIISENNRNAIMGAGMKAGEMNKASAQAEDMKWNRNASMYGQVMGMNNGAMQGLNNSTSGMANLAGQQSSSDQKNAAGAGQAGSAFATALFKADGGMIKAPKLASGGDAWAAYKAANPVKPMSSSGGKRGSAFGSMLGGAAPQLLGAGLKDVFKGGNSGLLSAAKSTVEGVNNAANVASQFGNGAKTLEQAKEFSAASEASKDAGYTGAQAFGTDQGANYSNSAQAAIDQGVMNDVGTEALQSGTKDALGDSAVTAGSEQAATLAAQDAAFDTAADEAARIAAEEAARIAAQEATTSTAPSILSAMFAAKGGYIKKKPGIHLALGGLANSSVSASDTSGNQSVATIDSSNAMQAAKMDDVALAKSSKLADSQTHAVAAPIVTEQKDPNAQSAKSLVASTAAREGVSAAAGTAGGAATGTGAGLAAGTGAGVAAGAGGTGAGLAAGTGSGIVAGAGGTGAGLVAGTGAGITAGATGGVATGIGGAAAGVGGGAAAGAAAGSVVPVVGTAIGALAGILASRYLADGGRVDHTDGGDVQGPGTETSDDIPAWLSDGEIVENADAVDLPEANTKAVIADWDKKGGSTKDLLLAINNAGLAKRESKFACGGAVKHGVKLAGGGFLGGNLGIAMGAGVDQWNKQQQIDMQREDLDSRKEDRVQQRQMNDLKIAEVARGIEKEKKAETVNTEVNDKIGSATALNAALKGLKGDEYSNAFKAYSDSGMTPSDLYRQAGVAAGAIDAGKNMQFSQYADGLAAQESKDEATRLFKSALRNPNVTPQQLARLQANIDADKGMTNIVGLQKNDDTALLRREIERDRIQNRLDIAAMRGGNGGSGGGDGSHSGSGKAPASPILSKKSFLDINKYEDPAQADSAYGHYVNLAREMGASAANESANNEAQRFARKLAAGEVVPNVKFNPSTMGFSYGTDNEQGGRYHIKRNVDPSSLLDSTKKPYLSSEQVVAEQSKQLKSFSEQRPAEFSQAQQLAGDPAALANWKRYYESNGGNLPDEQLRVLQAAWILNKIPKPSADSNKDKQDANADGKKSEMWGAFDELDLRRNVAIAKNGSEKDKARAAAEVDRLQKMKQSSKKSTFANMIDADYTGVPIDASN